MSLIYTIIGIGSEDYDLSNDGVIHEPITLQWVSNSLSSHGSSFHICNVQKS